VSISSELYGAPLSSEILRSHSNEIATGISQQLLLLGVEQGGVYASVTQGSSALEVRASRI
jgi:hypothetical protein